MADTTTTSGADANAGHKGHAVTEFANASNYAPADQKGYDPKDAKWATLPGAAARANNYPRTT